MECKACGKWFGTILKSDLCPTCERAYNRIFQDVPYNRLRELAQADKEGRVVVLNEKTALAIMACVHGCNTNTKLVGARFVKDPRGEAGGPWKVSYYDAISMVQGIIEKAWAALKGEQHG